MSYLAECGEKEAIQTVALLKQNKEERSVNRASNNGYSKDRTMRKVMSFTPEFSKFFDVDMDPHERKKNLYAFARKHPEYLVVDKI